jgi:hypothetical protein
MDNPTEQELRSFVGPKADYYLEKWQLAFDGNERGIGFNWAACLLSGLWLPYRKMYAITGIFFGLILVESVVEEVVFVGILGWPETPVALDRAVGIGAAVVCGVFGNRWYLSHARKVIVKTRSEGQREDAYLQKLARRGGTSIAASIGFFMLFLVTIFVIFVLLEFVIPTA